MLNGIDNLQYTSFYQISRYTNINLYYCCKVTQETQLPQKHSVTHNVSKFVLCFTSYGSKGFKQQK